MHLLWRIALLFVVFSLGAQWILGFNHLQNLLMIYHASSPHVEAFYRGVASYQWIDATLIIVGFLFRRGIKLILTKTITLIGAVVMPSWLRRVFGSMFEFPKIFFAQTISRLHAWHNATWGERSALWVQALQYSVLIFTMVLATLEIIVAVLKGVLLLPPIVLQYKVQLVTGVGSLALGTFVQAFLLTLWNQFGKVLPDWFWDYVECYKIRSFRRAVKTRRKLARLRHTPRSDQPGGP